LIQDYGMRLYNPALCKFLSVDPLYQSYPWNSTYAFAENRCIDGIDLDGGEFYFVAAWWAAKSGYLGQTAQKVITNFEAGSKQALKDKWDFITSPSQWPKAVAELPLPVLDTRFGVTNVPSIIKKEVNIIQKASDTQIYTVENISYGFGYGSTSLAADLVISKGIGVTFEAASNLVNMDGLAAGVSEGFDAFAQSEKIATSGSPYSRIASYGYSRAYRPTTIGGENIPASSRGLVKGLAPDFKLT
ncbi:MAG: hypothetical protein RLZZ292_2735, partial [Bacteroidota bacterium]